MRSLQEIIDIIRDGGTAEYEELRYAVCAMDALLTFDSLALSRLAMAEYEKENPVMSNSAMYQYEQMFSRNKTAMASSPKEWVGWNNDPDNPEFLKRRKVSSAVVRKIHRKMSE